MNKKQLLIDTTKSIKNINILKDKIINPKRPNLVIIIIVLLILAITCVWERVEIDAVSLNINKLKEEKSGLTAYNEILKAEIENKTRFESIDKIARNKLNMKFPGNNSVILVINKPKQETTNEKLKNIIKRVKIWE